MDPDNNRLFRFAIWLVRLRWLGAVSIVLVTLVSSRVLGIGVHESGLYILSAAFLMLNLLHRIWLLLIARRKLSERSLRLSTNFQISTDFLILTLLLHYSGGIQNPFIVYFIFHMVMASIILSPWESYLQASFAWCLVILLAALEFQGTIPHYPLTGFVTHNLFENRTYLFGTGLVFISTSYLVVFVCNHMVSQARRHEEAYLKANRELEKKDEVKNEYVLRITHDIKAHLAAIRSALAVLQEKPEGSVREDCKEFLDIASRRTESLIRFVKDLLYITRLKMSSEPVTGYFSIRESIQKVLDDLERPAREKSIRITVEMDEKIDQISGIRLSIEELILNLVSNAIQYSPPDSEVCLGITSMGNLLRFEVQDRGKGIPADEQELVFQEFYRGSRDRTTTDGTGLGLAIAHRIVQAHHGRLWLESQPEGGSKFCFTLPLKNIRLA
jgi:signal transduction histidine kinase